MGGAILATKSKSLVAVCMGSDSDYKTMKDALDILKKFKVSFEAKILSAHRTPQEMLDFGKCAHLDGFKVIIAGAGGAAHLPGMLASVTPLPVIGVPVAITALQGQDSLLSIVQMPKGVPVATMAIGNSTNAALLAVRILALSDARLQKSYLNYTSAMARTVLKKKLPK